MTIADDNYSSRHRFSLSREHPFKHKEKPMPNPTVTLVCDHPACTTPEKLYTYVRSTVDITSSGTTDHVCPTCDGPLVVAAEHEQRGAVTGEVVSLTATEARELGMPVGAIAGALPGKRRARTMKPAIEKRVDELRAAGHALDAAALAFKESAEGRALAQMKVDEALKLIEQAQHILERAAQLTSDLEWGAKLNQKTWDVGEKAHNLWRWISYRFPRHRLRLDGSSCRRIVEARAAKNAAERVH
jgi:hypothetical protein